MISMSRLILYASREWRATRSPRYPGSSRFPGTPSVYKYLAMEDLSQRPPAPRAKASVLDRYRQLCLNGFHCTNERNHFSPMSVLCVVK